MTLSLLFGDKEAGKQAQQKVVCLFSFTCIIETVAQQVESSRRRLIKITEFARIRTWVEYSAPQRRTAISLESNLKVNVIKDSFNFHQKDNQQQQRIISIILIYSLLITVLHLHDSSIKS